MKIVIAVSDFDFTNPGGVSSVVIKLIDALSSLEETKICVASFANSVHDENSLAFLKPKTYRNKRQSVGLKYQDVLVRKFGAFGSEFEVLRYRKRHELRNFFSGFDRIIVVTGVLSFANIIPRVNVPVFVQCATRISWERKSQYREMNFLRKVFLRFQLPLLLLQERRVLKSQSQILLENSTMFNWVNKRARIKPIKWFPGLSAPKINSPIDILEKRTGSLVSVGRFNEPRKGWRRLLLAYKQAYEKDPRVPDLKLIGWGEFSPELSTEIVELQKFLPIHILANLSNWERDQELLAASFFVQASYEEGLGLAALEALSYGTPLVCAETDGSREYLTSGINGVMVAQGSKFEDRFAEAISAILDQDYSKLHECSLRYFESKFEVNYSSRLLFQILEINFE